MYQSFPSADWFDVYEGDAISADFGIIAANGVFEIVLLEGRSLDFDEQALFELRVVASDGIAMSQSLDVSIHLIDVNMASPDIVISHFEVIENNPGAWIGDISPVGALAGKEVSFSLATGGDNEVFEIIGRALKLKDGVSANYEDGNIFEITIVAESSDEARTSINVVIRIVNDHSGAEVTPASSASKAPGYAYPNEVLAEHIERIFSGGGWVETLGTGRDLTYSFIWPDASSTFEDPYFPSVPEADQFPDYRLELSAMLELGFREVLDSYEAITLLSFVEVDETSEGTTGQLRFGLQDLAEHSQIVDWVGRDMENTNAWGDVWLSGLDEVGEYYNSNAPLFEGSYWRHTIRHEIGHALGLSHTQHASSISGTTYGENLWVGSEDNTLSYSVMSYFSYIGELSADAVSVPGTTNPTSLMMNDIAALQYMYGANMQTNRGNDIYTRSSLAGEKNNEFGFSFIHATIWDAAGIDTISWHGEATRAGISLAAGSSSFCGDITSLSDKQLDLQLPEASGVLGIAYGVEIENAIGGSGDDILVGNDLDNVLFGGTSRTGSDRLTGGAGADIFVCTYADAAQDIALGDVITDFTKDEDVIGLVNIALADIAWAALEVGTRVYLASSELTLFILEGVDVAQMDSQDFVISFYAASDFA